jgi:hypothetical protein
MRSADFMSRALRGGLAALAACASIAPAFAGGPLYVVPVGSTVKPARWAGTVQVYTDQGSLGALDNATANQLVTNTVAQWSSVPTSSFRAAIAGTLPADITGANAGTVIGARNGGGIQVIYDSDGSVLADFMGVGYGVLGIATPEYLSGEGSTQIVEGWMIIRGEEDFSVYQEWFPDMNYVPGQPTSGIVTHEFGHAINLAHTQTNGYYSRNRPNPELGRPAGPEQAGPDQCGHVVDAYPTAEQIETMYPFVDPMPFSSSYNSPQMATVNVADDKAALSSIYPTATYASSTGTLKGRVVAKDGTSQLTGINVIARRTDQGNPFDAISRISGDLTQGRLGPDGNFVMTGLVPGASYVLYIDEIASGGFSTPKAILLGPEEYWNEGESPDATVDDACAASPVVLAAGEVRPLTIAVNGILRAPTFTHIPYTLPSSVSDNGQQVAGVFAPSWGPFWLWDKQLGTRDIGGFGSGTGAALSGNGRVVGGGVPYEVESEYGPYAQERAALWTRSTGWKNIAANYEGCGSYHTTVYDLSSTGDAAVGLAFVDCRNAYAFKWTAKAGMKLLPKVSENQQCEDPWSGETYTCEGSSRANAMSGSGAVVGGWEEIPEGYGFRVGSLWIGNEQMLLRDPGGDNLVGGWIGEVTAINSAGSIAVGVNAGNDLKDAWKWTPTAGVTNLGRYPGEVCYLDWWTGEELCESLETDPFAVSDDGKVITGAARLGSAGVDEGAIYTPKMGWMLLGDFLQSQGVLEASRWLILGSNVSASGKVITGTGLPLAADYWHGFRLELDQVYVCHGKGKSATTLRVGFPDAMDQHLAHGDTVGFCAGRGPI